MKKLLSIMAVLFMAIINIKAQEGSILYTDFEPDTCFTFHSDYDTLKFDLDQDGKGDIVMFAYWHSAVGYIAVITTPASDWQWSWTYASQFTPLTDTTLLNGNLRWQYSGGDLAMYPEFTHFAFRHYTEDGYHYGWGRIYVESLARVCVDELAYCTIPDYPLQWGQTEIPPQPAIIYTDYEPDSCITDQYTRLWVDFDDDGNGDICLKMDYTSTGYWPEIISSDDWEITWLDDDDTDTIPNIDHWGHSYLWLDDEDQSRFAARKQIETDKYVFAWFEAYNYVTFNPFVCHVCFDKYAFCTIPNYPLQWGQTTIPQGVEEETVENLISVYPNPANTVLVVETQCFASQPTTTEYHIINTMGQTILSGRVTAETQQIDVESLPAGMYFISVSGQTVKFVVK